MGPTSVVPHGLVALEAPGLARSWQEKGRDWPPRVPPTPCPAWVQALGTRGSSPTLAGTPVPSASPIQSHTGSWEERNGARQRADTAAPPQKRETQSSLGARGTGCDPRQCRASGQGEAEAGRRVWQGPVQRWGFLSPSLSLPDRAPALARTRQPPTSRGEEQPLWRDNAVVLRGAGSSESTARWGRR